MGREEEVKIIFFIEGIIESGIDVSFTIRASEE